MAKKKDINSMGLTDSQLVAFRSFTSGANIFLTGRGGSGKSFLTRYIINWCRQQKYSVLVCAPTGIAAVNISGSTVHRVFRPGIGIIEPGKRSYDKKVLGLLGKVDVIVIDEISMCRADLFGFVGNTLLHVFKKQRDNGKRHQLLVVGDFYQLPPVLAENEKEAYSRLYGDRKFAFQTEQWVNLNLQTMVLQESMRQADKELVAALDNIREGVADFGIFKQTEPDPTAITICGTNSEAQTINDKSLRALIRNGAKPVVLKSIETGYPSPSDYPTDKEMTLCRGAKVIMINNDPDKRWVNGSFATVTSIDSDSLSVLIEGSKQPVNVERFSWSICEYVLEEGNGKSEPKIVKREKATIEQFPVKPAWAISIHKSQGQTYDRVNVNISRIFEAGQLYVALSRCRTLEGMHLIGSLIQEKVITDEAVIKFMSNLNKPELTGQMIPFDTDEQHDEDRYQEGWDDGYDYRSKEVEEIYGELVDADPHVKRVSDRVAREREKDMMPQELRNPRKAGRPRKDKSETHPSKAIRVPDAVAPILKEIGDICKDYPDVEQQCREFLNSLKEQFQNK